MRSADRRAKENHPNPNQYTNHHRPQDCPIPHAPQVLPAEYRTNAVRSGGSIRNAIRRSREDSRAIRSRRSAVRISRGIRKTKAPGTKWVPVDLTKIIADIPVPFVCVFKLQDISRTARCGDFEGMSSIGGWGISLRVCPCVGGQSTCGAARSGVLYTDVQIGGKGAFVDDQSLSWGTRAGAGGV